MEKAQEIVKILERYGRVYPCGIGGVCIDIPATSLESTYLGQDNSFNVVMSDGVVIQFKGCAVEAHHKFLRIYMPYIPPDSN